MTVASRRNATILWSTGQIYESTEVVTHLPRAVTSPINCGVWRTRLDEFPLEIWRQKQKLNEPAEANDIASL